MDQFNVIGEGAQHIVYQYIGEDLNLKDKVIRIQKPKEICDISRNLILPFNLTEWTPLKQFFTKKQPYKVGEQECEIMDNLFYDVVFAVELKPKTFLPILSKKQVDKDLCESKNQRFFMMQLWKAQKKLNKQGKNIYDCTKHEIDSITSKYDPRKFFNGKVGNIYDAIIDLQEYPENNYRLFGKEQKKVKQIDEFNNEEIASILSETLIMEQQLIPQLKAFFQMLQQMNVTIEETFEAHQNLKARGVSQEEYKQVIEGKCQDAELQLLTFKLLTFSSFSALSDLSIIGSFRNHGTGKFVEVGNAKLYYQYSIVDCDLKPLYKIEEYMSTVDELLKLRLFYDSLNEQYMNKLIPAIVADIDGVIVRGKTIIPKSDIVVKELLNSFYSNGDRNNIKIPFYLLTNGGGCTEQDKAYTLNKILGSNFERKNIFLNYTPLRPIMKEYSKKLVLVCGAGDLQEIAQDCNLHYYYTIDEYSALFDQVKFKEYPLEQILKHQQDVKQRDMGEIGKSKVQAVFIVFDPIKWEENIQTIINLIVENNNIPIYVVNNDYSYADVFRLPRIAFGAFTNALKLILQKEYSLAPNIIYYGKPSLNSYKYVQQYIHENHQNVGTIYMIGDNPASDIRGANSIGWPSFLVRTGVFRGGDNDPNDPGKYVVADLYEAYKSILQFEGLRVV